MFVWRFILVFVDMFGAFCYHLVIGKWVMRPISVPQVLHVYWFWCIIQMVIGLVGAIRST